MKVYLQYPWKFPDSPYYKYLIDNPPENIEFLNTEKQKGVIINKRFFWFSNFLKRIIRRFTNFLKLSIPNANFTKTSQDYDLIHCCHCLSKNKNKPWIADIESEWQFYIGNKTKKSKERVRKILLRENCKKIMPWTEKTKKEILKEFPEIKDKVKVVYPAIPLPNIKRKKYKNINLLFVGRYFYEKGGFHALEVIDKLTKKYNNVKGIIISEVPKSVLKKYSQNRKIKFFGLMPQEKLFKICQESDIFVYPGYSDSFGFSMLEAMSFGIPVVTVDGFARKEIVEENKTGFVIERPRTFSEKLLGGNEKLVIEEIAKKAELLIKNKGLIKEMSKNCMEEIKNGRFSIKERSKRLEKIYKWALG